MKLYPEYSENIIVYLVSNGEGNWYVTEKEIWFLDRVAWAKAFGMKPEQEDFLLSEDFTNSYGHRLLDAINGFKTETYELRELVEIYPPLKKDEAILEMRPSLYVDLDKKVLKNMFPEPSGSFENYTPKNWEAYYEDFWPRIPPEKVYWLVDGNSIFE